MTNKSQLEIAESIASLLDDRFRIFGIKVGLDPLLDLIPGIGDVISTGIAAFIILVALNHEAPLSLVLRMAFNWFLDFIIGLIPVLGAVGTVFFRSNRMNIRLLNEFLHSENKEPVKTAW